MPPHPKACCAYSWCSTVKIQLRWAAVKAFRHCGLREQMTKYMGQMLGSRGGQCGCTSWSVQGWLEQQVWDPVSPASQKSLPRPGTFSSADNSRNAKQSCTLMRILSSVNADCPKWLHVSFVKIKSTSENLDWHISKMLVIWWYALGANLFPSFQAKKLKSYTVCTLFGLRGEHLYLQIPPNKSYRKDKNFCRHLFSKENVMKNNSESQRRIATLGKITVLLGWLTQRKSCQRNLNCQYLYNTSDAVSLQILARNSGSNREQKHPSLTFCEVKLLIWSSLIFRVCQNIDITLIWAMLWKERIEKIKYFAFQY